jgi:hypothetical protein
MLKTLKSILLFLLLSLLFTACTSKEEKALLKMYDKKKNYHKQLLKTEKTQLKVGNITKVLLTATYISEPTKKKNDEVFIVGIYIEESDVQSFMKEGFSLTLGGIKAKSIKALKEHSKQLKDISFVSEWSQFYKVRFPHTAKKRFSLVLKSDLYGKGTLDFAKVAKYIFEKKGR